MAILSDYITLNLNNYILFLCNTKQNAYIKIAVSDTRAIFTKTKVERFIILFNKALSKKKIKAIYNEQTKK